jgi:hypothetical protein
MLLIHTQCGVHHDVLGRVRHVTSEDRLTLARHMKAGRLHRNRDCKQLLPSECDGAITV